MITSLLSKPRCSYGYNTRRNVNHGPETSISQGASQVPLPVDILSLAWHADMLFVNNQYIYIYIYVCVYVCIYIYICIEREVYAYIYIYINIYLYIYIYIHIHIHIHTDIIICNYMLFYVMSCHGLMCHVMLIVLYRGSTTRFRGSTARLCDFDCLSTALSFTYAVPLQSSLRSQEPQVDQQLTKTMYHTGMERNPGSCPKSLPFCHTTSER